MKGESKRPARLGPGPGSGCAERLRKVSRKLTGPRQAVLALMQEQEHPLTTKEILEKLPENCCDLATIYRLMHLLESMRLVKRFDFGDGRARFELIEKADDGHHHHLICRRCAGVVEIEQCFPKEFEERIAAESGFSGITHSLEFFGICPSCQR